MGNETDRPEGERLYQLGYLLSPLVAQEELSDRVEQEIKGRLLAAGGALKTEVGPRLVPLAYPIKKRLEHRPVVFKDAYFGIVRFDLVPASLSRLEEELAKSKLLVRFLIAAHEVPAPAPAGRGGGSKRELVSGTPKAEAPAVDVKTLDREIDSLLAPAGEAKS